MCVNLCGALFGVGVARDRCNVAATFLTCWLVCCVLHFCGLSTGGAEHGAFQCRRRRQSGHKCKHAAGVTLTHSRPGRLEAKTARRHGCCCCCCYCHRCHLRHSRLSSVLPLLLFFFRGSRCHETPAACTTEPGSLSAACFASGFKAMATTPFLVLNASFSVLLGIAGQRDMDRLSHVHHPGTARQDSTSHL